MGDLAEIKIKISAIETLEKKLALYIERLRAAEENTNNLLKKYKEEKLDVQKMQKESLCFYLLKLFGRYEGKLEKEEREEIEAKVNYDRAVTELGELKKEKEEIESKLNELHKLSYEYQTELAKRRSAVMQLAGQDGERYRQLEKEINFIINQITELDQALTAAFRLKQTAEDALITLDKAEGWATYDVWASGGLISHMAKYSHLDNAEASFNRLNSQLKSLRTELLDVKGIELPDFNKISTAQRVIDYWFDNIFTDISVRSKIRENISNIQNLIYVVINLENKLNEKRTQLLSQLDRNRRLQEELLISLD